MNYTSADIRDSKTGKWINSKVFGEDAARFNSVGYYTAEPKKTGKWKEYWDEQLRRCTEGYSVGGWKITGHHYEYLNYTHIKAVPNEEDSEEEKSRIAKKKPKAPDFWDGDYDYYWCLEIARNGVLNKDSLASNQLEKETSKALDTESRKDFAMKVVENLRLKVKLHRDYLGGGYHMIVGKSRRKGYSYKNAAICTNSYNTIRQSLCVVAAFDKKYLYPRGTMGMCSEQLSYLNDNTAFTKGREYVNTQEHKKASFKKVKEGAEIESGYLSEIMAITCKDNPDAIRGKDADYVLLEEAGKFPNLKATFNATAPGLSAGSYITGQILIFGTGGDMESGTADFAEMFFNPIQFNLMPFVNIWDKDADNTLCGFFHPVYLNMEGFYDEQGNSDIEKALAHELAERDKIRKNASSSSTLQLRVQEYPTCPSEAFLTVSINDFPIEQIRAQYNKVMSQSLHIKIGQPVYLMPDANQNKEKYEIVINDFTKEKQLRPVRRKIKIVSDLKGILEPIWTYKPKTKDLRGSVIIYDPPIENPPEGLYKIGHDPYRQQSSSATLPSLASIYVYKSFKRGEYIKNQIVAQYVGRPYDPDDVNKILEYLAELYNAQIMYENEVTHVKDYFNRRKKLHLLAAQPDGVISNAMKQSKVSRVYGIHMNEKLKDAGEKYIKQWLLEERDIDENGNVLLNLDFIYDPALLEELMLYNRKGNFDRVMGLMVLMFQLAEDDEDYIFEDETRDKELASAFEKLMETQFSNTSYYTREAA